jgi:hypothetical protein
MSAPVVLRCADGHFRRVIFSLGPFIADYPKQVFAAGIVQGWCPKYVVDSLPLSLRILICVTNRCDIHSDKLDNVGEPRTRAADFRLYLAYREDHATLWSIYGIVGGVVVSPADLCEHI